MTVLKAGNGCAPRSDLPLMKNEGVPRAPSWFAIAWSSSTIFFVFSAAIDAAAEGALEIGELDDRHLRHLAPLGGRAAERHLVDGVVGGRRLVRRPRRLGRLGLPVLGEGVIHLVRAHARLDGLVGGGDLL